MANKYPYRLYKRGDYFHAYFSFISETGQRIQFRESTGQVEEQKANQYCLKRLGEIRQAERQKASGELPSITIDEAFARYFEEKGQYLSLPHQRLSRLKKLKDELNVKQLHEIQEPQINQFIAKNRGTLSNSTINRYLFLLSAVITTARDEWKVRTYNLKPSKFKLKEPAENVKYLENWKTAEKIIASAPKHLKPIIYTALYTGLRRGNILALKWENIDFENNLINIRVKDRTKDGGKNLTIPMIDKLKNILLEQPKICDYVFTYQGKPISDIKHAWHSTLKKADLPYTNFHTLRHTAATWILKKTGNLKLTQQILGHSSMQTTLKYAHVLDAEKRQALEDVFN